MVTALVVASEPSAQVRKISGPLTTGGSVQEFALAPNGRRVVYRADQETDGVLELYSAFTDRRAPPIRLHPPLSFGRNVTEFLLSSDGKQVVYRSDAERNGVFELYGVPIGGSAAPVKLNDSPVHGGDVTRTFQIDPSGTHVVYGGDVEVDEVYALYSAALDGSSPPVNPSAG
jgi:hypothetical protein